MGEKKQHTVLAKIKSNKQGFTLLEIIIALSILSIGLLGLASLQLTAIRGKAFAEDFSKEEILAASRMRSLLALPYTDADLTAGSHTDPSPPSGYEVTWQVSDNDPVKSTKTIVLTVTWADHGIKKSVAMSRILVHML